MDVGIVTPRYPPNVAGGGEISVRLLAEQLQESDRVDDLTVLSFDGKGTERRNGVDVHRLADVSSFLTEWQNLRALPKLRRHVDEFDVLHAYNMELNPVVGAIGTTRQIGTVATLNSYHFLPKAVSNVTPGPLNRLYEAVGHPTTGRIMRRYMKQIDSFIALSSPVKNLYTRYGLATEKIEVIPNMLNPLFSVPESQSTEGCTVLYVGVLKEIKGVEYLLRAFDHLPETYQLRIVGDGPQQSELEELMRKLGLEDSVTFVGSVDHDQIPAQYAMADLFVHPAVWPEPFGRTILEAMQAGLPVVCTDIGGPGYIVQESELKCQPKDPNGLATAIEHARETAPEVGPRNRAYVSEEYSPEEVVSKIVDCYRQIQ